MTLNAKIEKLVPDSSVIIEGLLSLKAERGELAVEKILIHEAVLAELEHQANKGRAIGFIGLDELKKIQKLAKQGLFELSFVGRRPTAGEIRYAGLGEIDALIRQLAWEEGATLITADHIQARVAEAKGIPTILVPKQPRLKKLKIEEFFDEKTMSVHLREGVVAMAKKGMPGAWEFVPVGKKPLTAEEIKSISSEIIEEANSRADSFVEIEREGSTIVQLGIYRTVTTRPPFSDGWEITAVRPVKRLTLEDYKLSEKLKARIAEQAEGLVIAGSPGHGKSTFAQALAEHFAAKGKVVKTVEAPRDLVLSDSITQLAVSRGSHEEIHDILLLSRPDYTIFDEMRNTPDFGLFADLRLAGVGMVGVVHATKPIDAIQRFIGRIELGVIPHVIDTVVFIKNGGIDKVLSIEMVVKVPYGMTEADLARPTVVVSDFESGKPVAEIYSYGEQTVVVPVGKEESVKGIKALAAKAIARALQKYSEKIKVDIVSEGKATVYVPEKYIANIIGKEGRNIEAIEKELGIGIDVRPLEEEIKEKPAGKQIEFSTDIRGNYLSLFVSPALQGNDVSIYINEGYLATLAVGKKGVIKIRRNNKLGKVLIDALEAGERISLFLSSPAF
ncbi:MAG: PINc/VapC family ATPase [Candidatus Woesearchaeota archaeon]